MALNINLDSVSGTPVDVQDFVERCEDLISRLDDLGTSIPDDYREGCTDTLEGMRTTALKTSRVTERMQTALDNIERGVAKWER